MSRKGAPNTVRPLAEARAAQLLRRREFAARGGGVVSPDESALDRFLILTHESYTRNEQAALLRVGRTTVTVWRRRLYQRGRIRPEARASHAPITEAESEAVAGLYRAGLTIPVIARQRETNERRVWDALRRAGITGRHERGDLLCQNELAALLGVSWHTVMRLVRAGYLPAIRIGATEYGWERADVIALLRRRESWLALAPGVIRDPELSAFLRREQAHAGGRWHSRADLATAIGVNPSTITHWLRTGQIVLTHLPALSWGGVDAVWLTDAQALALEVAAIPVRSVGGACSNVVRQATARALPAIQAALDTPQSFQAAAAD